MRPTPSGRPSAPTRIMRPDTAWYIVLLLVAAVSVVVLAVVFAPGGMNPDTTWQLHQMLGNEPLSDWHPALMTITWRWVFLLTGHASALMYLQVAMMTACFFLLGVYVFQVSGSRAWSLAALGLVFAPHVFTYVGVLWKDTQMALAFLLATVAALLARRHPRLLWLWLPLIFLGLVYGSIVRKNAFFAVVPLIVLTLTVLASHPRFRAILTSRRRALVSCAVGVGLVLGAIAGVGAAITAAYSPVKTHQISQVMLDDVIFTVPFEELESAPIDEALRSNLVRAKRTCQEQGDYQDAYWRCYGRGEDGIYTAIEHVDELRQYWWDTVPLRPDRYLLYRGQTFAHFLFDNDSRWNGSTVPNSVGFETKYPQANEAGATYVQGFGVTTFPWLFAGWFWLLLGIVIPLNHRRISALEARSGWPGLRSVSVTLMVSSALYIVGYFPIVPANSYRYIYWPAIAGTIVVFLLAAAWAKARQSHPRTAATPDMPDRPSRVTGPA